MTTFESNRKTVLKSINRKKSFTLIYITLKDSRWLDINQYKSELLSLETKLKAYRSEAECYRVFEEEFVLVCVSSTAQVIIRELEGYTNLTVHYLFVENRKLPALNYIRQVYKQNMASNVVQDNILNKGFAIEEFRTVYQPILHKNEKLSFEALSRWNSRDLGVVAPNVFIPILDNEGLLIDLTKKIIDETVELLNQYKEIVYITINLTASLVKDITWLIEHLDRICFQETKRIAFELTEDSLAGIEIRENLKLIRDRGHLLFIDDFGSGYSNFQYLATFQFDGVKLDRLFMGEQTNKKVIVLLSKFIKALDLKFIIEGVERYEQLTFLLETKYDAIQGYYVSHPLDKDDVDKYMNEVNICL
ncbi:EAL domain-containing protein [Lysinibacillus sp. UGB7]|uniref:EAL domain-containing protein n=1 Tax=Lysinibacillus sp. UGB7 TaxID=3411039 RepID=UPI003B7F94DC